VNGADVSAVTTAEALAPNHLADLRASGLSDETIAAAGFRSLSAAEVRAVVGMDAGPGLAIPYAGCIHADGSPYVRVRLDKPFRTKNAHSARYLTRAGETPRLYVPPDSLMAANWRTDTTVKLHLVEGEKKALTMAQAGYPALAVAGVWAWMTNSRPLPDLDEIAWQGREVVVVGDSDLRDNVQSADGLRRLCGALISRKANATLVFLPPEGEGKVGADDFLVKHGTEAFAKVLASAAAPHASLPVLEYQEEPELTEPARTPTPALHIVELRDFLADETPLPAPVIENIGLAGSLALLFGPPESGKSWLGAEAARCVTSGRPFLGRFACTKGPAVLVEQESAPSLLRARLAELEAGDPRAADAAPLMILPLQDLWLDTPEAQATFREAAVEIAPRLVVVDTAISVAGTTDFLSAGQVRGWLRYFRQLASDLGALVILIAHSPKWASKDPQLAAVYGSVDFGASADFALAAVSLGGGQNFRLCCVKNRWGTERPDLTFAIGPGPAGGLVLSAASSYEGVRRIILDTLDALDSEEWTQGAELSHLVTEAGFTDRAFRKEALRLISDGEIERKPDPRDKRLHLFRRVPESGAESGAKSGAESGAKVCSGVCP